MSERKTEICHIRLVEEVEKEGVLQQLSRLVIPIPSKISVRYIAEKMTDSGLQTITKSQIYWYRMPLFPKPEDMEEHRKYFETIYHQVLDKLLADGWEPAGADATGKVTSLKKIPLTETSTSDPTELLGKLASLREAGLLTQDEFEAKKAEILRRL